MTREPTLRPARTRSTALRRWPAALLAVGLATFSASCGGDDQSSDAASDTTAASTTTVAPPSGPPVKVMVYSALSGVPTPFPEAVAGAQAAAKGVNDAGGVGDRPIEIVECDIGADPNGPVKCARQAVDEQVVAVVGSLDTTGDSLAVLQEAGIPSVSPYPRRAELATPVSYPVTTGAMALVAGAVTALADQGHERINVTYSDVPGAAATVEFVAKLAADARGVAVRTTAIPQPSADLAPLVADASRDVDAIAFVGTPTDAAKFVAAARQSGVTLPISGHSIAFDEATIETLGDAAEGLLVTTTFKPSTTEGDEAVDQFNAEMDAVDADARKNEISMGAWVGVKLLAAVAADLPTIDSASLIKALDGVSGLDLGLMPPVDFSKPIEVIPGLTRIFNTKVMYSEVTDGVLTPVDGRFVDVFAAS